MGKGVIHGLLIKNLYLQVRAILERLWENEAQLCSFICDIQGHQPSQKNDGYLMFLLKTIVVPPTKFRPPSKGGESVSFCWTSSVILFPEFGLYYLFF